MIKDRKTVLMIEDEPLLIDLYQESLSDQGFEFVIADDGEEGLKKAGELRPDLILLDILLPGINGFEVLRRLKASSKTKEIPVIVLTNLGSEKTDKDKQLALSLGAVDYFVKSYHDADEMVEIVTKQLKQTA